MNTQQIKKRKDALVGLLDDPAPVVQQAVQSELERLGEEGIRMLREWVQSGPVEIRQQAAVLLEERVGIDPLRQFKDFIHSFQYELETGSILLARTMDRTVQAAECCMFLDEVADRCRQLLILPSSSWEQCKVINRVLFHEYGFRGDSDNYYNPANSSLVEVIRRRKGLPISLSIIYLLVADRCGMHLEPVGVPGKFMVGCYMEDEPFYIDAFAGGAFREAADIHQILRSHKIAYDDAYFMPTPVGEVLCRCCRNLAAAYERQGNQAQRDLYRAFVGDFESAYRRHAQSE